ncbi:autotransporter outer membrane beta-barrel domain-containing protein [Taylorella equigenitalis]|uniref:autotransporter outer membrane beta-barrel domain-containing protein n=1 Tax=Taylorella equigenitalis TaxID=29575 RepID=UPI000427E4D5|nr:autotransporter outer membrane beta-barrel domain-containing protein [Taylorella equigenitalis]ASY42602.1 autotransporter outer membrane beta-barrel domain-containing protein [Taylorella equigenitalis]
MNKIFKVVYNKTLGSWVAVNEFARGYCKNVSTKKLIASLALSGMAMGVLAQTTTVDLTTLRFDPTVSGAPTDPNGPWGDNAGEGPIVAGAGETVNVTGSLENAVDNYKNKYAIINYYPHEKNDRFKNAVLPQDWEKIKDYVWNPDINDYGPKADNYVFDPKKSVVYEDSVTKSKTTIQVYDSSFFKVRKAHGYVWSMGSNVPGGQVNFYNNFRIVTAKEGGQITFNPTKGNFDGSDIRDGGLLIDPNNVIRLYSKNSQLVVADGVGSKVIWGENGSSHFVILGDALGNQLESDSFLLIRNQARNFYKPGGIQTTKTGVEFNIVDLDSFKAYNDQLIQEVMNGEIKSESEYLEYFKKAYKIEKISYRLKDELFQNLGETSIPMGTRSIIQAQNGGTVEIAEGALFASKSLSPIKGVTSEAAIRSQGIGSKAINRGTFEFMRGQADAIGMQADEGGHIINESTGHIISPKYYKDERYAASLDRTRLMLARGENSLAINRGKLSLFGSGSFAMWAYNGGKVINDSAGTTQNGEIFISYRDFLNESQIYSSGNPFEGIRVTGASIGENKGKIHIGLSPEGVKVHNKQGIFRGVVLGDSGDVNGAKFSNTGELLIHDNVDGATGIFINGSAIKVTNSGSITLNGSKENGRSNVGIDISNGGSGEGSAETLVTNSGIVNVNGSNNIGVKISGTSSGGRIVNTEDSIINVSGSLLPGFRNYGVWSEKSTIEVDGTVNLEGNKGIAIHARNKGKVILGANSKIDIKSGREHIAYFIHGAGSQIINNSTSEQNVHSEQSQLFRIAGGASYDGTSTDPNRKTTLIASGVESTALWITDKNSTVTTGGASITASGDKSVALQVVGGATGTLSEETELILSGKLAKAAVVDGRSISIIGENEGVKQGTKLDSYSNITSEATAEESRAYAVTNEGELINHGDVNLQGKDEIAVELTKGGKLVNHGNIVVAGAHKDGSTQAVAAVDVSGASDSGVQSKFEHKAGNIQLTNGKATDAAIRLGEGASLDMSGEGSTDATIKAGGAASVVLVDTGATGLTLGANTLSLLEDGTGAIVENKAEIEGIATKGTTFEVTDGIAIRSGTALANESSGTINITGSGTGIVFANRKADASLSGDDRWEETDEDLTVGGIDINVKDGATGRALYINTSGSFSSAANINLESTDAGAAWDIDNAGPRLTNSGNLTSNSANAIIDLKEWVKKHQQDNEFTNNGNITSPDGGVAIDYSATADSTISFKNLKADSSSTEAGPTITGEIKFGEAQVNLENSGVLENKVVTKAKDDEFRIFGANADVKGGIDAGEGDNTIFIQSDTPNNNSSAKQTGHITAGGGDDTFRMANGSSMSGNLSLGDGLNSITIKDENTTFTGEINTGSGIDTLNIQGSSSVDSSLVNLGSGNNDIKVLDSTASIDNLITGSGEDELLVDASGNLEANINLGEGTNSITNFGTLNSTSLLTGSGDDSLINSGTLKGDVNLGEGENSYINSGTSTAAIKSGSGSDTYDLQDGSTNDGSIQTGEGADTVNIDNVKSAKSIETQEGDDKVNVTGLTDANKAALGILDGGDGTDTLSFNSSKALISTDEQQISNFESIVLNQNSDIEIKSLGSGASNTTLTINDSSRWYHNQSDASSDVYLAYNVNSAETGVLEVNANNQNLNFTGSDYTQHLGTTKLTNAKLELNEANIKAVKAGTLDLSSEAEASVVIQNPDITEEIGNLSFTGGSLIIDKSLIALKPGSDTVALKVKDLNADSGTVKLASGEFLNDFDQNGVLSDISQLGLLAQDDGEIITNIVKATGTVTEGNLELKIDNQAAEQSDKSIAIKQGGEKVADAKYGIGAQVAASGDNKGINAIYALKELNILAGKMLDLRKAGEGDAAVLSAKVTGEGGIKVNAQDEISLKNEANAYKGATHVESGKLTLASDNATGTAESHTSKIILENGTEVAIDSNKAAHSDALEAKDGSKVTLNDGTLNLHHSKASEAFSSIAGESTLIGSAKSKIVLNTAEHPSSLVIKKANSAFSGTVEAQDKTSLVLENLDSIGNGKVTVSGSGNATLKALSGVFDNVVSGDGSLVVDGGDVELAADNSGLTGTVDIKDNSIAKAKNQNALGTGVVNTNDNGKLELSTMTGDAGKLKVAIKGSGSVETSEGAQVELTKDSTEFDGIWNVLEGTKLIATKLSQFGTGEAVAEGTIELKGINGESGKPEKLSTPTISGAGEVALTNASYISLTKDSKVDEFTGNWNLAEGTKLLRDNSEASAEVSLTDKVKGDGTYAVDANNQSVAFNGKYDEFNGSYEINNAKVELNPQNVKAAHSGTTLVLNKGAVADVPKFGDSAAPVEIGSLTLNGGEVKLNNAIIAYKENVPASLKVENLNVQAVVDPVLRAAGDKSKVSVIADEFVSDPLAKNEKALLTQDDAENKVLLIEATGTVEGEESNVEVVFTDKDGNNISNPVKLNIVQHNEAVAEGEYDLASHLQKEQDGDTKKGLYASYILKSLDLLKDQQLSLVADPLSTAEGANTLTAKLTGEGGLDIGTGNDDPNTHKVEIANSANEFTGDTNVLGGKLIAGSENALGSADKHTANLNVDPDAVFEIKEGLDATKPVHIGCLNADKDSTVDLKTGKLVVHGDCADGLSTAKEGTLKGLDGSELEVVGTSEDKKSHLKSEGAQDELNSKITVSDHGIYEIGHEDGAGHGPVAVAQKGNFVINTDGNIDNDLSGDGLVSVKADKTVDLSGDNSGLTATSELDIEDGADVTAKDKKNLGSTTVDTNNSGTINLTANGTIDAKVKGNGTLNFDGRLELTPETLPNFGGALVGADGSTLIAGTNDIPIDLKIKKLAIGTGSTFAGVGSLAGDIENNGSFIVGAEDKGLVTDQAKGPGSKSDYVVGGNFTNKAGGTIFLGGEKDDKANVGSTLTVEGDYVGEEGSKLKVNTIWNNPNESVTDALHVKGKAFGLTKVEVGNNGVVRGDVSPYGDDKYSEDVVTVDQEHEGNVFTGSAETEGAEQIQLVKVGNNYKWKLKGTFSQSVPGYLQGPTINLSTGFADLGTLNERIGAQSQSTNSGGKVWGRIRGIDLDLTGSKQFSSKSKSSSWQFGFDLATKYRGLNARSETGVMFGYTNTDVDTFDEERKVNGIVVDDKLVGGITTDALSLGVYHTSYNPNGSYFDLVGQVSKLKNKYNARNGIKADQSGWSALLSAEIGHKFALGTAGGFIEPQAQLAYQHLSLDDFKDKAREVKGVDANALRGRVGVRMGYDLAPKASAVGSSVYMTANLITDLTSNPKVKIGKDNVEEKFNRTFLELGLGGQASMSKSLNLYGDIRVQTNVGSKDRSGIKGQIGLKYSW